MLKNKLDFKLVNLALLCLVIYFLYHTGNLWLGAFTKIVTIIAPFFFAFALAYAFHPLLKWMISKKIPKAIAIASIALCIFGILASILMLALPLVADQLASLFNGIIAFLKELSTKYDIDFGNLQQTLSSSFDDIVTKVSTYVSNGAISAIGMSLGYLSAAIITISAAIYFLIDMDKIRASFGKYLKRKSKRSYLYVRRLDNEMKQYLIGMVKVMFITLIEYSIAYKIIGHPNALLLGFIACIAGLIPYFGGMFVNMIAAITAFVISPGLFLRTVITFVILSWVDGYFINPFIYGKSNRIHPLVVILSVFAGGVLFGIFGIIISLPVAITIIATYKYFKTDIVDKIEDIKEYNQREANETKGN